MRVPMAMPETPMSRTGLRPILSGGDVNSRDYWGGNSPYQITAPIVRLSIAERQQSYFPDIKQLINVS